MYLYSDGYSTEQHRSRGLFLMLVQPDDYKNNPPRAIVRSVSLSQFGHWMMGTARVKGHSLTVTGAYGNSGLTMTVPQEVYDEAVDMGPIATLWGQDNTGWNSAGISGIPIADWARRNIHALVPKGHKLRTEEGILYPLVISSKMLLHLPTLTPVEKSRLLINIGEEFQKIIENLDGDYCARMTIDSDGGRKEFGTSNMKPHEERIRLFMTLYPSDTWDDIERGAIWNAGNIKAQWEYIIREEFKWSHQMDISGTIEIVGTKLFEESKE